MSTYWLGTLAFGTQRFANNAPALCQFAYVSDKTILVPRKDMNRMAPQLGKIMPINVTRRIKLFINKTTKEIINAQQCVQS